MTEKIEAWIREQVDGGGFDGVVLGLSGGIDSAVVCGLAARALGPERVLGVIMPAHSDQADVEHGRLAAEAFGIEHQLIDLSKIYDAFIELLPPGDQIANANIKPRLRMITLYHYANAMHRLVLGTGNKSEIAIGYSTKYGDAGVDLQPIGGLLKSQVRDVARQIGVPEAIIERPPSAGLWEGQTDEQEMGLTYEELDSALIAIERGQADDVSPEVLSRVQAMHAGSEHKRQLPPVFEPDVS